MLSVDPSLFTRFPELCLGVIQGRGINNEDSKSVVAPLLSEIFRGAHSALQNVEIVSLPEVATWRDAYQRFGAKPSKFRSSIESLLRRVQKSGDVFTINALVDFYNALSIKHRLPCGAEDTDEILGPLRLAVAAGSESGRVLGETEDSCCEPGEVAYLDDKGFVCRRWNWREADRTKITPQTRNFVFIVEAVSQQFHPRVEAVVKEFSEMAPQIFGGSYESKIITS